LKIFSKDKRVEKLIVTTSQHSNNFFEKFGYHIIRIVKDYWGKGLDLYEMEQPNEYKWLLMMAIMKAGFLLNYCKFGYFEQVQTFCFTFKKLKIS
tara:strand:- start:481 stop:765 length:285 start_codon:yes stop_codon:yes gene_type:complete